MSSRVLLFSDAHMARHKKSLDRLQDGLNVLEWVFATAQTNKIDIIIFAGDLFHDREKIDILVYLRTFEILEKYLSDSKLNLYLLVGNHDMWSDKKWDVTSVRPLSALAGVTVIDKPCTVSILGHDIDFLPYTKNPLDYLNQFKKRNFLIGHLALDGAKTNHHHNVYSDVVIEHDGDMTILDSSIFSDWRRVWLGHYHFGQEISHNVEYIGSPLQLTFGEAFTDKHIIIWDLDSNEKTYVKNNFSPQYYILRPDQINDYKLEKNFIRIEVEDLRSLDVYELRRQLGDKNPAVIEFDQIHKKEEEHIIDDAKAILYKEDEMLETYVDSVLKDTNIKLDKNLLLSLGRKICAMEEIT